jgi:hypothetical protein
MDVFNILSDNERTKVFSDSNALGGQMPINSLVDIAKLVKEKNESNLTKKKFCVERNIDEKTFTNLITSSGYYWNVAEKKYIETKYKKSTKNTQRQVSLILNNVKLTLQAFTILHMKLQSGIDRDTFISSCIVNSSSKEIQEMAKGYLTVSGLTVKKSRKNNTA